MALLDENTFIENIITRLKTTVAADSSYAVIEFPNKEEKSYNLTHPKGTILIRRLGKRPSYRNQLNMTPGISYAVEIQIYSRYHSGENGVVRLSEKVIESLCSFNPEVSNTLELTDDRPLGFIKGHYVRGQMYRAKSFFVGGV